MTIVEDPENAARMAQAALDRLTSDFAVDPGIAQLSRRLTEMGASATP
jgi:hypothetical protein